jgi:phosphatidate cytidylyltransferase
MKRVLTAAVAIPLVVLLTIYSPNWVFASAVGLVCAVAAEEFLSLAVRKGIGRPGRWFLAPAALVGASFIGGPGWVLTALAAATISLMTVSIFTGPIEGSLGRIAMGLGSLLYCSLTLGFLVMIQGNPTHRNLVLLLFVIIWTGDTAAYYGGRALGRHLLAPRVSPKKTVEGAIAGLIVSVLAGTAGGVRLTGIPWLDLVTISAVTAVMGQLGDLAESVLKRSAGVKDSSSVLPGHGGILDRLDSLFFATPVFYWFFKT